MKLYMHPAACSLSPHIVCRELALPVDLVEVDRASHRTSDGRDYREINGNGYVPALVLDDGRTLIEGPAIVQFLAGLNPDGGLLPPAESPARTAVQAWLNFITAELHKPMGMLFNPAFEASRPALHALVTKRLDWLSEQLTDPYLAGTDYSVADVYLFVCLNWTPWVGIDLAHWPVLVAFMRRVGARPKVQEALAAEGLVPHGADGLFHAPAAAVRAKAGAGARP